MEKFNELSQSTKPVLVDFYAEWCGPCQIMKPRILDVAERIGDDVKVIQIDIDKENLHYIAAVVKTLSEKYKVVIILFYWDELSIKDIAKVLKVSEDAVKKRLERARKLIKIEMEE